MRKVWWEQQLWPARGVNHGVPGAGPGNGIQVGLSASQEVSFRAQGSKDKEAIRAAAHPYRGTRGQSACAGRRARRGGTDDYRRWRWYGPIDCRAGCPAA
jgi:hypothetical protein